MPGNVALDYHYGDAEAVKAAFAKAAHVTKLNLVNSRLVVNAMEPRAALASYDGDRFTLHVSSQGVFGMRANIAEALGVPPKDVHVITGQVGGSFGMKAAVFPEYICVLHAARALGRPVKWTDERSGSFVSDSHGRNHDVAGELALDADGNFLAVRLTSFANVGAFLSPVAPMPGTLNAVKNVQGMYRTPLIEVSAKCVFTNTSHVSAYRGAGRPEGNYYMERLIDAAAAEMGIDRVALRKRNQISPRELPYKTASGGTYDSGDFAALTKQAFELADGKGFRQAQAREPQARQAARHRHRQLPRSHRPAVEGTCRHQVQCRRHGDAGDRHARFRHGPRHAVRAGLERETRHSVREDFAAAGRQRQARCRRRLRRLEIDHAYRHRDRRSGGKDHREGQGTGRLRARSLARRHRLRARQIHHRRHRPRDLDHGSGGEAAQRAEAAGRRPQSLDITHVSDGPGASTYPNGCHVAEVEVDPETGVAEVVSYVCVNDFGTVINPMIVEGQLHGGVVQGIGQALMEHAVYDRDGQLLTGSFMDYAMPRAADVPSFSLADHPAPATTNPLGVKGCGEAGCAGALTSVMNAVIDALVRARHPPSRHAAHARTASGRRCTPARAARPQ